MRFQAIALLVLYMSQKAWTCQHGDIRLNQGDDRCASGGVVAVCLSGTWRAVCGYHWDSNDAGVVCTQLGHLRNGASTFLIGMGSQPPIYLNNVHCSGSELRVIDCPYSTQTGACMYNRAGVFCEPVVTVQDVTITAQSQTALTISWLPPCGDILEYEISCSAAGSSVPHSSYNQTAEAVNQTLTGLHTYTTRYNCCISVTTTRDEGTVCITSEAAPTDAPRNVRGYATGPTSLLLRWSPPLSQYQNGRIRYYIIWSTLRSFTTTNTQLRVPFLHPYTRYSFRVAAVTVAQGPWSAFIAVWTSESAPTAPPRYVNGHATGPTSLLLYWSPPPSQHWNGRIRRYRISVTDENMNVLGTFTTTNTQRTIPSLHPYTRYHCRVAAVTVAQGPWSAFIAVWTSESAPTAAPQNVGGNATGSTSLLLYWSPPPPQHWNGRIQGYYINVTDETTNTVFIASSTSRSLVVSSLYPYSTYWCTVAAVTVAQGPPSTSITIQTHEDVPTVAPTVNSTVRRNATTILITLQPLTQRESRGVITVYNITYRGFEPLNLTCHRSDSTLSTTSAATYMDGPYVQLLIDQLDPRLSYCLEVAAATSVGVGPSSEPIAVGLYSNDPFQVHLSSGDLHCDHWLAYGPSSKWDEISQVVSEAIQGQCQCPFTLEYIADGRLMCSGSDSVVFQGRIISTDSPPNRELLKYLQEWVQSTPTVIIEGVHLHISNCSVHLNELGSTEANCTEPAGLSAVGISFIITTCALVAIIFVASAVICSVYCWKKRTLTEDMRDSNSPKGRADDVDEPKACYEYSAGHSVRKDRKCKSIVKPETIELSRRKLKGAPVAQDKSLPHPEIQNGLPEEDKGPPILPPRLYLKDEEFASKLYDTARQNTAANSPEKAVHFGVHGKVIQTVEVPNPTITDNAIYQPLLPKRMVTDESCESSDYQPLTFGGTNKEEEKKMGQSATGNENSNYQPLIFKSASRNGEQKEEERGQFITTKERSETSRYQPLVFPKESKKLHATHVMMTFLTREPTPPDCSSNRKSNSTGSSVRL